MSGGDFCAPAAQHFQLGSASPLTSSCVSNVEPHVLTQTWKVNNFSLLLKLAPPKFCLRSNILSCSSMPGVNWQLCLYPGLKLFDNVNTVSVLMRMFATPPREEVVIKAECCLLLLGDNDEIKFSNVKIVLFHARPPRNEYLWGCRDIPEHTVRQCMRSDHSLVIKCSISFLPDASSIPCRQLLPSDMVTVEMTKVSYLYVKNGEL
ncbi:BTB/POZ domain [Parelaphostrongylus tenuis]|uniref:BTB/POZ domain n=1 Tax=Parelaphostrongylus tenuis TaxID=148309 RepID=A0AAD5N3P0_PARTN|nr:BTB/POZ domain [Parelaphostrongylus tenuis]